MAKNRPPKKGQEQMPDTEKIERRLNMLDQRLDSIDSMVSAVIERVMNQPIAVGLTCPHCGKNIEYGLIGNKKPHA